MKNCILNIKRSLNSDEALSYRLAYTEEEDEILYNLSVTYHINNSESEEITLWDISRNKKEAIDKAFLFAYEQVTPNTAEIIMEELLSKV